MKRDYSNLPEHLPSGKLAFNDSTNELFIGAGENAPLQKITNKDIEDELKDASVDYSGEHHANLKDSMDANVDFIMGEFNSTQMTGEFITAQNTIPRHIKRAELKGHTEVNLIQEPSGEDLVLPYEFEDTQDLTIENTKESGALNVVLKGNTEVNVLKNPVKDYVVPYEFEEGYDVTLTDTKETGSVQSAILKGQTLVNLIPEGRQSSFHINNVSGGGYGFWDSPNVSMIKPSTKYLVVTDVTLNTGSKIVINNNEGYISCFTDGVYYEPNEIGIKKTILTSKSDLSNCTTILRSYTHMVGETKGTIQVIEYQDGMENWNIPYFDGMQSVKMPVLTTTTSQNLSSVPFSFFEKTTDRKYGAWTIFEFDNLFSGKIIINKRPFNTIMYFDTKENRPNIGTTVVKDVQFIAFYNPSTNIENNNKGNLLELLKSGELDISLQENGKTNVYSYKKNDKTNILSIPIENHKGFNGMYDTVDCITGEVVERIGERTYNGTESWYYYAEKDGANTKLFSCLTDNIPTLDMVYTETLSNYLIAKSVWLNDSSEGFYIQNGHLFIRLLSSKLVENSPNSWLSDNPLTVQFKLLNPSIKTVDLSIVDQDGSPVPALSTYNGVTHLTASSEEGSLKPLISSKIPEFPVLIKPNTKYSIVADTKENGHEKVPLTYNLGGTTVETEIGNKVTVIQTPSTLTNETFKVTGTGMKLSNVMILEKDLTGKEIPNYTEGMNSVKVSEIKTTGKNLFKGRYSDFSNNLYGSFKFGSIGENYTISIWDKDTSISLDGISFGVSVFDNEYHTLNWMTYGNVIYNTVLTTSRFDSFTIYPNNEESLNKIMQRFNIQIEYGNESTPYEPYKESKLTFPEVELNGLGEGSNRVEDTLNLTTGILEKKVIKETFIRSNPLFTGSKTAYHQNTTTHCGFDLNVSSIHHHDAVKIVSDFFVYGQPKADDKCYIRSHMGSIFVVFVPKKPNGDNLTLDEFHALLDKHRPTVAFVLQNPIQERIDVSGSLKTWNTKTHFFPKISEGALNPIISSKPLEYEVLLKPNTKYSIITNPILNGHTSSPISFDLGGKSVETVVGNYCTLVTTPSTLTHEKLVMRGRGHKLSGGVMIFEGDKTGMKFNHFDGMKSVEDFTVKVRNANLFSGMSTLEAGTINENGVEEDTSGVRSDYLPLTELMIGDDINIKTFGGPHQETGEYYFTIFYYDENKNFIPQDVYAQEYVYHLPYSHLKELYDLGVRYYRVSSPYLEPQFFAYVGNEITISDYEVAKENSASFKIPMRSLPNGICDTLNLITGEYVQNIEKVHLDGSNTWGMNMPTTEYSKPTIRVSLTKAFPNSYKPTLACDKLVANTYKGHDATTGRYISALHQEAAYIYITRKEIGLVADENTPNVVATTFKNWLDSIGGIDVQYQLSEPIVTNLDLAWEDGKLFAYDGTTYFHVDVEGGHLQPVLDIDVPVNITAELSRLRAEKEQLQLEKGQLESQLSLVSYHNEDLSSNVQSLLAENSQLKLQAQDLQTRSNVLQLKNKELQQHQDLLQAKNEELEERATQLTQTTENLTEGLQVVDSVRESGDLELLSSDFDLDFRLMEIEFALDIAVPMSINLREVKNMARTPYEMAKTLILGGKYDRADMEYKLSRYLERKQITQEQHDELLALMEANDLV